MSFRNVLIKLHLYVAFLTALPLLVVAITGALLVYGEELDRVLNPKLSYVAPGPVRQSLQKVLDTVRAAYPDQPVMGFDLPPCVDRTYALLLWNRRDAYFYVYVNPYTAEILGMAEVETMLRRKLFLLHTRLMAGPTGNRIVFWSTVLNLFMVVTGIVLWWRRKITTVKLRTSWKRLNFDLHNVTGLYPSVVVVLLAVTGILISFDEGPTVPRSRVVPGSEARPLDEVVASAARVVADARITFVVLPSEPDGVFQVRARVPQDRTVFGRVRIYVDQYSGQVLGARNVRRAILVEPIHFGDIFGTTTQLIAILSCLVLPGQVISGLLIWWNAGGRSAADMHKADPGAAERRALGLRRPS